MVAIFSLLSLQAEEIAQFSWEPLEIKTSMFSRDLEMLDSEREEYATNLAAYAANEIARRGASIASLNQGRRALALAMHLSPRNRQAIITQFQLGKGLIPEKAVSDYSPQVFARLLLTRGQLLQNKSAAEDLILSRYMIHLAAEIDPRNQDAVYGSELLRIDHGPADWAALEKPIEKAQ